MPTTYLLWRRRLLLVALLMALALGVLAGQVRALNGRRIGWLGVAAEAILMPATAGLARLSDAAATGWSLLHEIGTLRTENARLSAEVTRLREENARLHQAAQENDRLRTLLAFKAQLPHQTVAAHIIGRDPSHWFNTIVVDRGMRDGVRRNDPAVTGEGVVGHVIEAAGGWARVLLIVDPRSAVSIVAERSREAGVAEGEGRPDIRVKYLSRDADVQPGDRILTAGWGEIYPRGLIVGTVTAVTRTRGELFQEAAVRPAVDLNHLEDVLILVHDERTQIER